MIRAATPTLTIDGGIHRADLLCGGCRWSGVRGRTSRSAAGGERHNRHWENRAQKSGRMHRLGHCCFLNFCVQTIQAIDTGTIGMTQSVSDLKRCRMTTEMKPKLRANAACAGHVPRMCAPRAAVAGTSAVREKSSPHATGGPFRRQEAISPWPAAVLLLRFEVGGEPLY
jgi:hypothetical protein